MFSPSINAENSDANNGSMLFKTASFDISLYLINVFHKRFAVIDSILENIFPVRRGMIVINVKFVAENMSDDEYFAWLYSLTMVVYDIGAKDAACSKGQKKRWSDLADIWGRCASGRGEFNLFVLALHKIHWGVHVANFPKNIPMEMVETVEAMLLQNGAPFNGWKRNKYYRSAFDEVVYQYRPVEGRVPTKRSDWYMRYIRNHTWLYVAYKREKPPTIDLANYTRAEFVSAKKHATIYAGYQSYKLVISKLIPESLDWDEADWLNEQLIYSRFKKIYGMPLKAFVNELDYVISFLVDLWYYDTTSVVKLLRIKYMPDRLMEVIWPQRTQREVTNLLCLAYSRVKSANTYLGKYDMKVHGCTWKKLHESWVFNRCKEWVYSGELIDAAPRTKKIVFEIETDLAV